MTPTDIPVRGEVEQADWPRPTGRGAPHHAARSATSRPITRRRD